MASLMKAGNGYPIGYVSRLTGLSPHLIRAWERRYGVVRPDRTPTRRRLYSAADIERLRLLKKAAESGHRISALVEKDAQDLAAISRKRPYDLCPKGAPESNPPVDFLPEALFAAESLDPENLEKVLLRALAAMPRLLFLSDFLTPFLERMGELWAEGKWGIVHEHTATPVVRSVLWDMIRDSNADNGRGAILVTAPTGQRHELGALMAAVVAADCGWRIHYAGPDLPSSEMIAVSTRCNAKAVCLSISLSMDPESAVKELGFLKRALPDVHLFVGGRASLPIRNEIEGVGGKWFSDLSSFAAALHCPCAAFDGP